MRVIADTVYVAEEHPDIFGRLPAERAPWDAVRHVRNRSRAREHVFAA
jgi:hypothetical protein